ncbi:MAG: sulfotransferase [Alphaproteobacteria bacterium]|nr:sulfotransferase [Alphaproteobacteria bacterium]
MSADDEIEKIVSRFATMRELAAKAASENANDARALFGAAMAFRISGDYESALAQWERLCSLDPKNTHYLYERGQTQEYFGQFDEAIASYRASLTAEPFNYRARHALVQLERQSIESNHIAELERQFAGTEDGWRTLYIGHALARTYEDIGDTAKSFEWLGRAKQFRRSQRHYNVSAEAELSQAALSAIPGEGAACEADDPIFIVGLPRSGTTLLDRVLSSHPQVTSGGEMGNFPRLLKLLSGSSAPLALHEDVFSRAGQIDYARLGRAYIDSTRPITGATPRFIDKAPSNYFLASLILRALPNARVICIRRKPLDSCLSNYKQIFPMDDRYFDYVYDIGWAAEKYVAFDRMIAHWRDTLPANRFTVLQYEDLVANQEARTREMLAFCGLDWDERTLSFHESATAGVSTPSARQVRQAMNAQAVGRWVKYGDALDPARRVFERAGIAID